MPPPRGVAEPKSWWASLDHPQRTPQLGFQSFRCPRRLALAVKRFFEPGWQHVFVLSRRLFVLIVNDDFRLQYRLI